LTSLGEQMRLNTVKLMLSTFSLLHATGVALRGLGDRIRSCVLVLALSVVYFLLVTPIAWRRRRRLKRQTAEWKNWRARTGWKMNEQSTSDPEIYVSMSSNLSDLVTVARRDGDYWMPFLNDTLLALRGLAKPPKDRELSTDLYVMF
jgi:hypothetical protein